MKFRTKVEIEEQSIRISHEDKIAMIGSCFTNNIGEKLSNDKFDVSVNPFGILFNPISVANAISHCLNQKEFGEQDLIHFGEKWLSFEHHSSFNSLTKEESLRKINASIKEAKEYYLKGNILFITLGTAWVYVHNKTNKVVANCHKIPNKEFTKRLLNIEEIVIKYNNLFALLKKNNPNIKVVFTVSPVRHWKDGVVENNRSKAVLHLAIMELVQKNEFVSYFPSYEIMLDELRDYRFYKDDLLHPNQQAVDYIYERFAESYYTDETQQLNKTIQKLKAALGHKPFNIDSKEHQLFLEKTHLKVKEIEKSYPYLKF